MKRATIRVENEEVTLMDRRLFVKVCDSPAELSPYPLILRSIAARCVSKDEAALLISGPHGSRRRAKCAAPQDD